MTAQGTEARRGETAGLDAKRDGPVGTADAPNPLYQEGYSMTDTTDQQAVTVAHDIARNPESIWLSPICDDTAYHGEGRTWATPAPDETCEDCSEPWVKYVRVDLASVSSASAEGFVLVPRKLTDDMHEAVVKLDFTSTHDPLWPEYWAAMLDAAPTPEPVPATNQAGEVDVTALQERIADLEGELEEALYQPWPKWAEDMKKQIRDVSGYDGYDDATDGVNLPDELSELINELTEQADKNVAEARAARKLDELESSVEHYRNGMNEWIAKAQALAATQPATPQEGEAIAMARRCQQARHSAVEPVERDNVLHEAATLLRRLAATPTPPTLSEDLREALKKIAAGTTIVLENGEDWPSPLGARHSQDIALAALAQVKAS